MKRPIPVHPVLLAAFPPIFLYVLNMGMVSSSELWRPLLYVLIFGCVLYGLGTAVFRNAHKGALVASVLISATFSFGLFKKLVGLDLTMAAEALYVVAAIALVWRVRADLSKVTKIVNFFAVVLLCLSLVRLLNKGVSIPQKPFLSANLATTATPDKVRNRPDIFFIILDGYGRADQLRRVMGFDNSGFVQALEQRGFYVAAQGHSTYCQTQLSLASTLNLSLIQDFPKSFPPGSNNRAALTIGTDRSFVAEYLKSLGYRYAAITTGFDSVRFDSADRVLAEHDNFTMLEAAVLTLTPIPSVAPEIESMFNYRRRILLASFENLERLSNPTSSPRLVVAHILAPHPPFVFDHSGKPTRYKDSFGYYDGSHYMQHDGSREMYRHGYSEQIQYINSLVLKAIDSIRENDPDAVILLQGDHGSKLGLDQESLAHTDLTECFSNLLAFRAPESVTKQLYPGITSVNTFRVVFNGLFDEKLPLLPDRSYYSSFSDPYRYTDVTAKLGDGS